MLLNSKTNTLAQKGLQGRRILPLAHCLLALLKRRFRIVVET